ncbi:MAG: 16S rRNA (adenine(1518)-N(6)/adenine(1519)-N(6))-dimethyltransferase RsmA [bacterium]|nr:16S rRNA (adenine(1518)-N(6)/adenine(1519)-N(6))-dimethyltransferase RsmA [bacterium]
MAMNYRNKNKILADKERLFPRKSLGQHFLKDRNILKKISDNANLSENDTVLEVGPGEGTLTELLLEKAGRVIAVEKDARLIPVLKQKFAKDISIGKLKLIHADILSPDTSFLRYTLHASRYKIVANLPYYITGQFLRKFLSTEKQPEMMVVLLQKEVAKRIVGRGASYAKSFSEPKKESLLSISVKAYGNPIYVDTVKAGSFSPPPKVDSAILKIENISKKNFEKISEEKFFDVLKRGFSHPRKILSSNLKVSPEELDKLGVDSKCRAEDLSLENWKAICDKI